MANDPNTKRQNDDPRQATEEGEPGTSGRVRGHVSNEVEDPQADRNNPDAGTSSGKKDVGATTPHLESGDRA